MAFTEKTRHYAQNEEKEQKRAEPDESNSQRSDGYGLLDQVADGVQHRNAVGRLHARALQLVVKDRILKGGEVEPRRVPHDSQAYFGTEIVGNAAIEIADHAA